MSFPSNQNLAVNGPFCTSHIAPARTLRFRNVYDKPVESISYRSTLACQSIKKLSDYLCPLRTTLLHRTLIIFILAHTAGLGNFGYSRLCTFAMNLIL